MDSCKMEPRGGEILDGPDRGETRDSHVQTGLCLETDPELFESIDAFMSLENWHQIVGILPKEAEDLEYLKSKVVIIVLGYLIGKGEDGSDLRVMRCTNIEGKVLLEGQFSINTPESRAMKEKLKKVIEFRSESDLSQLKDHEPDPRKFLIGINIPSLLYDLRVSHPVDRILMIDEHGFPEVGVLRPDDLFNESQKRLRSIPEFKHEEVDEPGLHYYTEACRIMLVAGDPYDEMCPFIKKILQIVLNPWVITRESNAFLKEMEEIKERKRWEKKTERRQQAFKKARRKLAERRRNPNPLYNGEEEGWEKNSRPAVKEDWDRELFFAEAKAADLKDAFPDAMPVYDGKPLKEEEKDLEEEEEEGTAYESVFGVQYRSGLEELKAEWEGLLSKAVDAIELNEESDLSDSDELKHKSSDYIVQ